MGGWGPELDAIVAPILPCLGPVGGLGVDHDGVATAKKECRRVEGRKGRARKVRRGFFKEAHLNGGQLISGAAQERRVMFLEELVAVVAGEEASSLTGEAGEPGYIIGRRILGKDYSAKHIIRWSRATNLSLFFYSSNTIITIPKRFTLGPF